MNETRRFFNQSQPQTLQIGVMLLYINAFFLLIQGAFASLIGLALIAGLAGGGFGIANEKKWGYQVAVAASVTHVVIFVAGFGVESIFDNAGLLLPLMFDLALVALLLHPQSREYQKIWFS